MPKCAHPKKREYRTRAHANPLSTRRWDVPRFPAEYDWAPHFPGLSPEDRAVRVVDVGCGFGGLLTALAPRHPRSAMLGLEIRSKVAEYVSLRTQWFRNCYANNQERIANPGSAEKNSDDDKNNDDKNNDGKNKNNDGENNDAKNDDDDKNKNNDGENNDDKNDDDKNNDGKNNGENGDGKEKRRGDDWEGEEFDPNAGGGDKPQADPDHHYNNVSCLNANAMKFLPNYIPRGSLDKIFFLYPDPHFKRSKNRLRIIDRSRVAEYAFVLGIGAVLYTATDVLELHEWMVRVLDACPLFERIGEDECAADEAVPLMLHGTEEAHKVRRNKGSKYPAVYRRIRGPADDVVENQTKE